MKHRSMAATSSPPPVSSPAAINPPLASVKPSPSVAPLGSAASASSNPPKSFSSSVSSPPPISTPAAPPPVASSATPSPPPISPNPPPILILLPPSSTPASSLPLTLPSPPPPVRPPPLPAPLPLPLPLPSPSISLSPSPSSPLPLPANPPSKQSSLSPVPPVLASPPPPTSSLPPSVTVSSPPPKLSPPRYPIVSPPVPSPRVNASTPTSSPPAFPLPSPPRIVNSSNQISPAIPLPPSRTTFSPPSKQAPSPSSFAHPNLAPPPPSTLRNSTNTAPTPLSNDSQSPAPPPPPLPFSSPPPRAQGNSNVNSSKLNPPPPPRTIASSPSGSKQAPSPSLFSHPRLTPPAPSPFRNSTSTAPTPHSSDSLSPAPPPPPLPFSPPHLRVHGDSNSSTSQMPENSSNSNMSGDGGLRNSTSLGGNGIKVGSVIVIALIAGFLFVGIALLAVWCIRKKNKKVGGYNDGYNANTTHDPSWKSDYSHLKVPSSSHILEDVSNGGRLPYSPPENGGLGNSRSWFTYEELLLITNGFSEKNLLGEGGFGSVYKGCLPDGREVAIKQLKVGGSQGEREFKAEVEIISRIHHRHLVSLVGYCIAEHQRLLVYDYVPNNTLYHHLHGKDMPILDWTIRLKVAIGAARGIAYLHEDCQPRIIHRDIKSSNILLDSNFEAQVSDFGLAKIALDSFSHVTTRVIGTFGYMAPEYASSGKLTDKSDVYSFGVVLLELITGRKPVDTFQPLGDESLVEWARPLLPHALESGDFEILVDPRLEKNYVKKEMFRMIEAAAACVRHSAGKRPRMGQIVRSLEFVEESDLSNGMKVGQSNLFDSAQQSAEIRLFQRMAFGRQDFSIDSSENG